uniref:B1292H11.22 protein n=1 Tax=Oryza sativa subsp. japonica TaxID=39947 RepID=Q6MWA9_ORYSJ|nr:B1292H11.22 [Oryza sativa Japonica Group]
MAQDAGDAVLPASRITADRHLSLVRRFMPEGAIVRAGESRPRPRYPDRSVHLLSFAMAGLIPPFSSFFHEVLDFYEIHALHLAPNTMMTLAIFAHLCEMFIEVRTSMRLFQFFFVPQLQQSALPASLPEWAQVAADRTRVDEGHRAVDALVEAGRKMHQARLAEIQARDETMDSIMREMEEERLAALVASSVLDEVLGDSRLQYEVHAEDLARRVEAVRGVLKSGGRRRSTPRCGPGRRRLRPSAMTWTGARRTGRSTPAPSKNSRPRSAGGSRGTSPTTRGAGTCAGPARGHLGCPRGDGGRGRIREEAAAERTRTTAAAEAAVARRAEELGLWEVAWRERDTALAEREAEVNCREVAARRLGDQLMKREEAIARREACHLESAWAKRAAMAALASELEAKEKAPASHGQHGDTDLVGQLTAAQDTIAALGCLVQDQAGEIRALCFANDIGPGLLHDAIEQLERAERRVGISMCWDKKLPCTRPALAHRLDEMAADLEKLEEEVSTAVKSSSASLARAEDFPPGTEATAREQAREATDVIVSSFEGTAPRFNLALPSDEDSGSDGGGDDSGEDWDEVVSGARLRGRAPHDCPLFFILL